MPELSARSMGAPLLLDPLVEALMTLDAGGPHKPARRPPARGRAAYTPDDPLLKAAEAAAEVGRGLSTFWRDVRAGLLPPAYYVTPRSPRWRRSELRAAIDTAPRRPAGG